MSDIQHSSVPRSSIQRTALYACHVEAGAKMIDFGGWDMPLHYGSQVEEHLAVRQGSGMFDVSHMTVLDISGADATTFLRYLLANDVGRLTTPGKALYSPMLNERGGVIDDLIVYALEGGQYRVVSNCATRDKDLAWMASQAEPFAVSIDERRDVALVAVQGPRALAAVTSLCNEADAAAIDALRPFHAAQVGGWYVARTGYTGEDGVEIMLPAEDAVALWQQLRDADVKPAGLGARDTLRLEAGMNLYGNDMDENTTPLEVNIGWTVAWEPQDRDFIGREALERQRREGVEWQLMGLVMRERGVLRSHMPVHVNGAAPVGAITSGTFSPSLGHSIGLARLPAGQWNEADVEMRGKRVPVKLVKPGFVRHGKKIFD